MVKKTKTKVVRKKKKSSPKKLHYQIINALRRLSTYHEPRLEVKAGAKVAPSLFGCSECKTLMYEGVSEKKLKEYQEKFPKYKVIKGRIELNHIEPVVGYEGFVDYNTYIERLFCKAEGFNALCRECHQKTTNEQDSKRK